MEYRNIYYKDVLTEIENEYVKKYPKVINKIELYLTELLTKLEVIGLALSQIAGGEYVNSNGSNVVEKLNKQLKVINDKRFQYLNLSSINELIELSLELTKSQKSVSMHVLEAQGQSSQLKAWKELDTALKGLKAPINKLKKQLDKDIIIFKYLSTVFEDVNKSLKRIAKEAAAIEGIENMDVYISNFNTLFTKIVGHSSKHTNKVAQCKQVAYNFVERAILIRKLEMLLEYPKQLAFQYKIKEKEYTLSNKKPESFTSILHSIGSPAFVRHKILSFKLEDVLYTLRELYASDEDEPDQSYGTSGYDINFDEDVFIELYINYHKTTLDLEFAGYHTFENVIADYQSQPNNDYKIVKETGNKISEQFNRIVRYNMFNDVFNEFREKMQVFFFEEFNELIDVYYN